MKDLISVVVLKSTRCLCTFRSRFRMYVNTSVFPERAVMLQNGHEIMTFDP